MNTFFEYGKNPIRAIPSGILLLPLCGLMLLYTYKANTMQDSQTLISAARDLHKNINPYLDPFFLNSFVISIPYHFAYSLLGEFIFVKLYVLANLTFLVLVLWDLIPKSISSNERFLAAFALLSTSPIRAMVDSVQHSGVVLGLIYLFLKLQQMVEDRSKNISSRSVWLMPLLLIIPFELKPQLLIPVLVVIFFRKNSRNVVFRFICYELILHISVSLVYRMPLDYFWVVRLLGRSSETTSSISRENSLWSVVGSISGHHTFWLFVSFAVYISVVLLTALKFRNRKIEFPVFLTTSLSPLLLAYVHTYDFAIISIMSMLMFSYRMNFIGRDSLLLLLLLPTLQFELRNFLIAAAIYMFFRVRKNNLSSNYLLESTLTLALFLVINFFMEDTGTRVNLILSAIVVLAWVLFFRINRLVVPDAKI